MRSYIIVDNISCNGCATTIKKQIETIPRVTDVDIEIETGMVSFTCQDDDCRWHVATTLKKIGYPLTNKGLKVDIAKPVNSCVKG